MVVEIIVVAVIVLPERGIFLPVTEKDLVVSVEKAKGVGRVIHFRNQAENINHRGGPTCTIIRKLLLYHDLIIRRHRHSNRYLNLKD